MSASEDLRPDLASNTTARDSKEPAPSRPLASTTAEQLASAPKAFPTVGSASAPPSGPRTVQDPSTALSTVSGPPQEATANAEPVRQSTNPSAEVLPKKADAAGAADAKKPDAKSDTDAKKPDVKGEATAKKPDTKVAGDPKKADPKKPDKSVPAPIAAATESEPTSFPPLSAHLLKEMRRKRARNLMIRVLALVVLPTLVAAIYLGLVASGEFESSAQIVVERREPMNLAFMGDNGHTGTGNEQPSISKHSNGAKTESVREDALLIKEYILSHKMLEKLDKEVHLLEHYRKKKVDFWSRLSPSSSKEQAFAYYLTKVDAQFDSETGILKVRLLAFDGEIAAKALGEILKQSEQMLSGLRSKPRKDNLELAEGELKRAKEDYNLRMAELAGPQVTAAPTPSAAPASKGAPAAAAPKSATAAATPAPVAASPSPSPKAAADTAPAPVASAPAPVPPSPSLVERAAIAQQRFARAEQAVALLKDENKRADRYVVRISEPSEPDDPRYPRRGRAILTTFLFSIVAMGILSLVFSAVREHANL